MVPCYSAWTTNRDQKYEHRVTKQFTSKYLDQARAKMIGRGWLLTYVEHQTDDDREDEQRGVLGHGRGIPA